MHLVVLQHGHSLYGQRNWFQKAFVSDGVHSTQLHNCSSAGVWAVLCMSQHQFTSGQLSTHLPSEMCWTFARISDQTFDTFFSSSIPQAIENKEFTVTNLHLTICARHSEVQTDKDTKNAASSSSRGAEHPQSLAEEEEEEEEEGGDSSHLFLLPHWGCQRGTISWGRRKAKAEEELSMCQCAKMYVQICHMKLCNLALSFLAQNCLGIFYTGQRNHKKI